MDVKLNRFKSGTICVFIYCSFLEPSNIVFYYKNVVFIAVIIQNNRVRLAYCKEISLILAS